MRRAGPSRTVRLAVAFSFLLPVAVGVVSARARSPQQPPACVAPVLEAARSVFSGQRAFETTAFVEQYWRIPGNTGFDASLDRIVSILEEVGYRPETEAAGHPYIYRIEERPLARPAWDPIDASVSVVGEEGPLLRYATNRNMMAANSWPTPPGGIEAPLVYVGSGRAEEWAGKEIAGAIVFGETSVGRLYSEAMRRGALGALSYRPLPGYNRSEEHPDSITFTSIAYDEQAKGFGICLSRRASEQLKAALERGPVRVRVMTAGRFIPQAVEHTLVAEVRGSRRPDERLVLSAHVQEPGANDNATGVAVQAEIARSIAELVAAGWPRPERTITFLWGDEITSTRRFMTEDAQRAAGVRWGISLDMVGEDTAKTDGTFLIEKLPDPSAVWTRGEDHHTEWGGRALREDALFPHYLNDFVLNRCREQAADTGWVVASNPYEGGSDHVPFLSAKVPAVLLWHFTDVYYHTDGDRIDKVSRTTLTNTGVSTLTTVLLLASGDEELARLAAQETEAAARRRLEAETALGRQAVAEGADPAEQAHIVRVWTQWYADAVRTIRDLEVDGPSGTILALLQQTAVAIERYGEELAGSIR
jgi:aminopeptidase YwaD